MARPRKVAAAHDSAEHDNFQRAITELLDEMNYLDSRKRWADRRQSVKLQLNSLFNSMLVGFRLLPPYQRGLIYFAAGTGFCVIYGTGSLKA